MHRLMFAVLLGLGLLGGAAAVTPGEAAPPRPGGAATADGLIMPVQYRQPYYAPPRRVIPPGYTRPRYAPPGYARPRYAPPRYARPGYAPPRAYQRPYASRPRYYAPPGRRY